MKSGKSPIRFAAWAVAAASLASVGHGPAMAQDASALAAAGTDGKDWLTYHGSYQSWHYSPLKAINTGNVKGLKIAFIHQVGRSTRGIQ